MSGIVDHVRAGGLSPLLGVVGLERVRAAEVRHSKRSRAVAAIRLVEQEKERGVLGDRQDGAVAARPTLRCEVEGKGTDLADEPLACIERGPDGDDEVESEAGVRRRVGGADAELSLRAERDRKSGV